MRFDWSGNWLRLKTPHFVISVTPSSADGMMGTSAWTGQRHKAPCSPKSTTPDPPVVFSVNRLLEPLRIIGVIGFAVEFALGEGFEDFAGGWQSRARNLRLGVPQPRAHQRLGTLEID